MSDMYRDGGSTVRVVPPTRHASILDAAPSAGENATLSNMPLLPDLSSYRIQRWIGDQDLPSTPNTFVLPSKLRDSEEAKARREHDHIAEVDWELEEFEREMALRFVIHDLELGLEERRGRNQIRVACPEPDSNQRKRSLTPWLRTQSSTATLQPSTPTADSVPLPLSHSLSPTPSSYPPTPPTPTFSCPAPPPTPATPDPSTPSVRPSSLRPSSLRSLLCPPPTHKPSPSVLSLSSHFSSCTSSVSNDADVKAKTEPEAALTMSTRSLVSNVRRKIKHSFLIPPIPSPPSSPYMPKTAGSPTIQELGPMGAVKKRRRVSVPASLGPKKRRLVVRGIKMDDEYALEGIRRWACSLGEVNRILRVQDGTIWIEFKDRRVAESVCCLQAQVQIPHVGRVVLDWAEGRHPG